MFDPIPMVVWEDGKPVTRRFPFEAADFLLQTLTGQHLNVLERNPGAWCLFTFPTADHGHSRSLRWPPPDDVEGYNTQAVFWDEPEPPNIR
jgi:hypothetical protein